MAKKATAEAIEVAPQKVAVKAAPKKSLKPEWEIKDKIWQV